ncbi:hypothetical protein [Chryseobacterium luquanense]|uniref:Uncharacterized protein n=1 Tax=Chryseobacterium luquanense TaxID=2983766 RepID=A0ABT3Y4V2_9FLAO|nr:hypothetical protein [Chryseobacterium luquanense]MCX8533101.1 hypothetical protein [Chryseobacterium luquanense]
MNDIRSKFIDYIQGIKFLDEEDYNYKLMIHNLGKSQISSWSFIGPKTTIDKDGFCDFEYGRLTVNFETGLSLELYYIYK